MDRHGLTPGDVTRIFVPASRVEAADARFERTLSYAEKAGDHVWVAIASYVLSDATAKGVATGDPTVQPSLDVENLAGVQIGCYRCEQALERRLVGKRCPGDPR